MDFSTLHGYYVKDATARASITALETKTASDIETLQTNISNSINAVQQNHETDMTELEETINGNVLDVTSKTNTFYGGANILLMGDSSISDMFTYLKLDEYMPNCVVNSVAVGGAKWIDVATTQFNNIETTPDIIVVLCGSNDISYASSNYDFSGDYFGKPLVTNHTYNDVPTTSFDAIKSFMGKVRATYPKAQVYGLLRADHPSYGNDLWHYFKYYEAQILVEWGASIIDTQELLNFAYWVNEQKAWATASDGQHYSAEMYDRYQKKLANLLNSGCPSTYSENIPSYFCCETIGDGSQINNSLTQACLAIDWALTNCVTRDVYNYGNGFIGNVGSSRKGWVRFIGVGGGYYGTQTRFILLNPNECYYCTVTTNEDGTKTPVYRPMMNQFKRTIVQYSESLTMTAGTGQTITFTEDMIGLSRDERIVAVNDVSYKTGVIISPVGNGNNILGTPLAVNVYAYEGKTFTPMIQIISVPTEYFV